MTRHGASTRPGLFPGFGEDAPLDLTGLTAAAEAGIVSRIADRSFGAWAETAARVGYCTRPVRLVGSSTTLDAATGEVLGEFTSEQTPLGVLYRPCGNRRANECAPCSRVYARDTFEMIRAGLVGGKTIPATVADNPLLFVTLTAPSFGHVHGPRPHAGQPVGGRCRPRSSFQRCPHGRPIGCHRVHAPGDPVNGAPLCGDCYDWASAVVWQLLAPELWRRTTITLRRNLARALGVPEHQLRSVARLEYAKVAEYQTRGSVHFHGLLRLDGPDGPGSPAHLDGKTLARVVRETIRQVGFTAPGVDVDDPVRVIAWGSQLDLRVVREGHRTDDPTGPLTPEQVAGYLAKYATKDAGSLHDPGNPPAHLVRLAATCRTLADRARRHDPESPYRRLAKWAHMLGFPGHFSTKSRGYSITLGRLRRARHRYRIAAGQAEREGRTLDLRHLEELLLADDDETTLVVGSWLYQGTGWPRPGDEALALAAAARAREYAQWRAQQRRPG